VLKKIKPDQVVQY